MKNIKIWASSLAVATGISLCGCSAEDYISLNNCYKNAFFSYKYGFSVEQFLEENGIIDKRCIGYEPLCYYEVKVSEPVYKNGELVFNDSWKKVENIDDYFGIARKVNVFYKLVSIEFSGNKPVIKEIVTNDLLGVSEEYKYVYKDDYVILDKSDSFYVNNGKKVGKVR